MKISRDEVIRCMNVVEVETGEPPSAGMASVARVYAEIFKKRFALEETVFDDGLNEVKEAIASSRYRVGSDEVAEKMLGRVISDKVR
jgi:hypothetical protein